MTYRPKVTVTIVKVKRTEIDPLWYAFSIKTEVGCIQLGFESTIEKLEERWGYERDVCRRI